MTPSLEGWPTKVEETSSPKERGKTGSPGHQPRVNLEVSQDFVHYIRHPWEVSKLTVPSSITPSLDMPIVGTLAEPVQIIM